MKSNERIHIIIIMVFFVSMAIAYFLPPWVLGIVSIILVFYGIVLFAKMLVYGAKLNIETEEMERKQ